MKHGIGTEMINDQRVLKRIGIGFLLLLTVPIWPLVWIAVGLYKMGKSFDEDVIK
jgi:uncharacterized membrane protein